ncbi:MAG: polyamine aminopropyltransferase [Bacillota bacterium]
MSIWFTERQSDGYEVRWLVKRLLHQERTAYQQLTVVELAEFGRALLLDDIVQTTVGDEYIYHEMIVHTPLFVHPAPRRVLVIGGGDGGAVREALRHPTVDAVDLVEIDERVVAAARVWLPEIAGSLDDRRVRLHYTDGFRFVAETDQTWDAVIVDASDPIGPAVGLFSREFHQQVRQRLAPEGVICTQSGSPFFNRELLRQVAGTVAELYPQSGTCLACIPTYPSGLWSFTVGSLRGDPSQPRRRPDFTTRYYSSDYHRSSFTLPPFITHLTSPTR